jgi:hypothetical protein
MDTILLGKPCACPQCGSSNLAVSVTGMAEFTGDQWQFIGETLEYDADSYTACRDCGTDGNLDTFFVVPKGGK